MLSFDLTPHPELISPEAWVAPSADVVGRVRVGADSSIWYGVVIRGDLEMIEIGEGTNVQDLSIIHTNAGVACRLGDRVTVGHGAIVHGAIVEDDVLIGMRATVLNYARIGAGSFIAAGTLVSEGMEIPPGWLAWGSPAKLVRPVDASLRRRIEEPAEHYREITRSLVAGNFCVIAPPAPATPVRAVSAPAVASRKKSTKKKSPATPRAKTSRRKNRDASEL